MTFVALRISLFLTRGAHFINLWLYFHVFLIRRYGARESHFLFNKFPIIVRHRICRRIGLQPEGFCTPSEQNHNFTCLLVVQKQIFVYWCSHFLGFISLRFYPMNVVRKWCSGPAEFASERLYERSASAQFFAWIGIISYANAT